MRKTRFFKALLLAVVAMATMAYGAADTVRTQDCVAGVPRIFDFAGRQLIVEVISNDTGGTFSVWYEFGGTYTQYSPDTNGDSTYPFWVGNPWRRDFSDGGDSPAADETRVIVIVEYSGSVTVVAR